MGSYPPQQSPGGYPPQGNGYPPQGGGYPAPGGGYPPPGGPGAPPPPYQGGALPPYQQYAAPLPGQPGYQWGAGVPAFPYASFGKRLGALLVDGLILALIIGIPVGIGVALIVGGVSTASDGTTEVTNGALVGIGVLICIVASIAAIFYEPLMTARKGPKNGQTIGRQALGIRITNLQGGPITAGQAWGRHLFKAFFSGSIFYLGYLWMLWDSSKQTWHDKVANTLELNA